MCIIHCMTLSLPEYSIFFYVSHDLWLSLSLCHLMWLMCDWVISLLTLTLSPKDKKIKINRKENKNKNKKIRKNNSTFCDLNKKIQPILSMLSLITKTLSTFLLPRCWPEDKCGSLSISLSTTLSLGSILVILAPNWMLSLDNGTSILKGGILATL